MRASTVRNIAIVVVIAAAVVFIPGGKTSANIVIQAISLVFLGSIVWFASIMYRQHRMTLMSLGDRRRAVLYIAAGVAVVTLTATHKMWATSAGSVAWVVLMAGAVYATVSVLLSARRY
jgi:hypothetical protein